MEPEGSLPHSQVPATCLCPESARSRPYPHIPLPDDPSLYYPPIYAWFSQAVSFPQVSPPKLCICLSSHPYALHAHLILLDFITRTILSEEYRSLSSSLCSFLNSLVPSSLLGQNILFNTLFSNTLSLRSSLSVSDQVSHPHKTGKL